MLLLLLFIFSMVMWQLHEIQNARQNIWAKLYLILMKSVHPKSGDKISLFVGIWKKKYTVFPWFIVDFWEPEHLMIHFMYLPL